MSFTHKFYDKSDDKTSRITDVSGWKRIKLADFLLHQFVQTGVFIQGAVEWRIKFSNRYLSG
jgi:hypothetical protein